MDFTDLVSADNWSDKIIDVRFVSIVAHRQHSWHQSGVDSRGFVHLPLLWSATAAAFAGGGWLLSVVFRRGPRDGTRLHDGHPRDESNPTIGFRKGHRNQ